MITKEQILSNYKYFKAERECPFPMETGKAIWWNIEKYAFDNHDEKNHDDLSSTMVLFIKERHWQSESGYNTTWNEAYNRALELYEKGLWSSSYISNKETTIDSAY